MHTTSRAHSGTFHRAAGAAVAPTQHSGAKTEALNKAIKQRVVSRGGGQC